MAEEERNEWGNMEDEGERHNRDYRKHGRDGYKKKGHQVLMQATVDLGFNNKKMDKVEVDLWYSDIYEIFDSQLDLKALAIMQDIYKG